MKKSTVVLFASFMILATSPSFAREAGDREPRSWSRTQAEAKPEIVHYEGLVRCKNGCNEDSAKTCDMEFVRNDGETFDLEDSPELAALHCQNHSRDLKVSLEAEKTPRFLFWGGNLVAKNFQVKEEVPSVSCALRTEPATRREPAFRGKASI